MEFTNDFTVPVTIERTFEILTDLEQVAPCLPGAVLEEVDGSAYTGRMKVKVGPITVTYRGTAEVTEREPAAKRVVIKAAGKETRGSGTATANVVADLDDLGEQTRVSVKTDLAITGKPAQFGRGVMADVGSKIIGTFAERLAEMIEEGKLAPEAPAAEPAREAAAAAEPTDSEAAAAAEPTDSEAAAAAEATGAKPAPQEAPQPGPHRVAPPMQEPEPLDLMEVAGGPIAKRLVPLVAALAVVASVIWWWRRR